MEKSAMKVRKFMDSNDSEAAATKVMKLMDPKNRRDSTRKVVMTFPTEKEQGKSPLPQVDVKIPPEILAGGDRYIQAVDLAGEYIIDMEELFPATKSKERKMAVTGFDTSDDCLRWESVEILSPKTLDPEGQDLIDTEVVIPPSKSKEREMAVTGYDTSLPEDDIISAVRKHFSSCGEITDVLVGPAEGRLCFVSIRGDGAVVKAVKLRGGCKCEVEGCKIRVYEITRDYDPNTVEDRSCGGCLALPCGWLLPPDEEGHPGVYSLA